MFFNLPFLISWKKYFVEKRVQPEEAQESRITRGHLQVPEEETSAGVEWGAGGAAAALLCPLVADG